MKLKYLLLSLLFLLMTLSIAEIFPILPKDSFWHPWYRSEYFSELDREFQTAQDAFLSMKLSGKSDLPWIFLRDFETRSGIAVKVYSPKGEIVSAPGISEQGFDATVMRILQSPEPSPVSDFKNGNYYRAVPVAFEKPCRICHSSNDGKNLAGVFTFERKINSIVYFSAERRLIFTLIALFIGLVIYAIIRWDPDKKLRNLLKK